MLLVLYVKTVYWNYIRGCSAKSLFLAQLSDYWNVVFDENTASKITDVRFRRIELIANKTNYEPN